MYRRIVLIGSPGSGKSTLARRIGELLELPVIHLDAMFWQPGWVEPDKAWFDDRVREVLVQDEWVIDGGYSRTLPERLERADLAILFDLPRRVCLYRVVKRRLQYRNQTRPDMAPGCQEKVDREFLSYIFNYSKDVRDRYREIVEPYAGRVEVKTIRNNRDIDLLMDEISRQKTYPISSPGREERMIG